MNPVCLDDRWATTSRARGAAVIQSADVRPGANPHGGPLSAECVELGYQISPRTVAKYRPSGLDRQRGQRWTTFIRNHLHETWACDFFVLVTGRFRVLYVFVVLSLGRRTIVHAGVTEHPSACWVAQRLAEATSDAHQIPRFLVHDRDSIYGADFHRRVRGLGTRLLATPPRSPTANPFGERVIGTLRRDCFDHIIVKDEQHAERVLHDYLAYYHGRPHRGLRMQPPTAPGICPLLARQREPESLESQSSAVSIIATALGWLHWPHRRRKSVPLEPRMEFLRPTTGRPSTRQSALAIAIDRAENSSRNSSLTGFTEEGVSPK